MKKLVFALMLLISSLSFSVDYDFHTAVKLSLGGYTNMDVKRFIKSKKKNNQYYKVHVNIDSNLFQTNSRFNIDAYEFFKYISKNSEFDNAGKIALVFHDKLVDDYGNEKDYEVAEITFTIDKLKKINWDKFLQIKIPNVADHYWVHPAIDKK